MTREQVLINHIQEYLDSGMWQYETCYLNKDDLKVIIKALEQEPCEDAISRQAVFDMCKKEIDHISKNWQNYHSPSEAKSGFAYIATNINDLPPVNPQPKTGHWVRQTDDYHDYYECEYCGIAVGLDDIKNYCPNCGCRMLEGSE